MNFTRILSFVPYPFKFRFDNAIYSKQACGSNSLRNEGFWESLFVSHPSKSFFVSYYTSGVSRLLLKHFIWSQLSHVMIKAGIVSSKAPPSSVAQTVFSDQLRLLQIRYEIDSLSAEREKVLSLFASSGPDNSEYEEDTDASPEEIQSMLDKLGDDLAKLNEEKAFIKDTIKRKKQILDDEKKNESDNLECKALLSDTMAEWILGITTTFITETIIYPFFISELWMYLQDGECSLWKSTKLFLQAYRYDDKHLYDGFAAQILFSISHSLLMFPMMKGLKYLWNIPSESQLQSSMRILLSAPDKDEEDLDLIPFERKREIVNSFRAVMKNTLAYTISSWTSRCILYPVLTCRTAMAGQGSSFLTPQKYSSFFSCMKYINRTQGFGGFYNGFAYQFLSIIPELFMLGTIYIGVSLWIEYRLPEEDEDDYDNQESDDESSVLES